MENKGTILVVDDDELVLKSLTREIKEDSYQVLTAINATNALQILKENQVDVVISDHKMPGVQGMSLLRIIKDHYPDVVRIMLTGHADLEAAITAINEIEVFRFYTKPWNRQDILSGLVQAMRKRRFKVETKNLFRAMSLQLSKIKSTNPELAED